MSDPVREAMVEFLRRQGCTPRMCQFCKHRQWQRARVFFRTGTYRCCALRPGTFVEDENSCDDFKEVR